MIIGAIVTAASQLARLYASTLSDKKIMKTDVDYIPDTSSFKYAGLLNNQVAGVDENIDKKTDYIENPNKKTWNTVANVGTAVGGVLTAVTP